MLNIHVCTSHLSKCLNLKDPNELNSVKENLSSRFPTRSYTQKPSDFIRNFGKLPIPLHWENFGIIKVKRPFLIMLIGL